MNQKKSLKLCDQNQPATNTQFQQKSIKKAKSGVNILKNFLIKKAENIYKLNLSDQVAFRWKLNKSKQNRPLSSFRLIKKQLPKQNNVTFQTLMDINFPALAHTNNNLATFATNILKENTFFKQTFNNQAFLSKLITEISLNYNIVSYHNFSHAFSLMQMLFQSFETQQNLKKYYSEEDRFYSLLAGLAHDLNHPGTNNAYQIKLKTPRARQSNNQSVLQSFHVRELWKILDKNPQINFLQKIKNAMEVKKNITYLILMTDVAQHFKNLELLKTNKAISLQKEEQFLENSQNKKLFLGQLFHACDIGNPCVGFENYITWAALLSYEFNEQTFLQKENEVEVTQMFRYKDIKTFYQGQIGFINYLVHPLWKQIVGVCDNLKIFTNNIENNIKQLKDKIEQEKNNQEPQLIKKEADK